MTETRVIKGHGTPILASKAGLAGAARITAVILLSLMFVIQLPMEAAAGSVPGFKAKKTNKNVLRLTKKYNRDAHYILNAQRKLGHDLTVWLKSGKRIVDKVDTCVHEEFHSYSYTHATVLGKKLFIAYYAGGGKSWHVELNKIFKAEKVMKDLPERLRTYRYKTYVSKGSDAASNKQGVYGMLNEFSAYYWGMDTMYSFYPYLKARAKKADEWMPFILSYLDNREAYSEFYFWTLTYLRYAKKNKPKVYRRIMENRDYLNVLYNMERRFRKLIKKYDRRIEKVARRYNKRSFAGSCRGGHFYLGTYRYPVRSDYKDLRKEIASKKFSKVKRDIRRNK